MIKRLVVLTTAVVALAGFGIQVSSAAQEAGGAQTYRNCRAMHRDWEHGVARSRAAARAEVRDGYGRPHVSRAPYGANRDLDANDDGVACEA
jgi:Excalibur calcium-binding domain